VRIPDASIDSRLSFNRLPGQVAPERWALESAKTHGVATIKKRFKFENEGQASEILSQCGLGDPHSIPYELGLQSGLSTETAEIYFIECVIESSPEIPDLVEIIKLSLSDAVD